MVLECRVQSLGSSVASLGFREKRLSKGSGFRVEGLGKRIQGFGFRV